MEALCFRSVMVSEVDYMQRSAEMATNSKNMMFGATAEECKNVLSRVGIQVERLDLIAGFDRNSD